MLKKFFAVLFVAIAAPAAGQVDARMFRYPAISADKIAFVYAGDIWLVPKTGGTANRLSSPPGEETFPRFSPDGTRLAYSADYDGNTDVYVVPVAGGDPMRLTHHPMAGPRRRLASRRQARAVCVRARERTPALQPVLSRRPRRRPARETAGAVRRVRRLLA